MNIHFKIKQFDPRINSAEIAYSTDVLTDAKMLELGRAPFVVWVTLPFPMLPSSELQDYLWERTPLEYFETLEREVLTGANSASIAPILSDVGVERTESAAGAKERSEAARDRRIAAGLKSQGANKRFSPIVRRV